jgi:hypothetical protein
MLHTSTLFRQDVQRLFHGIEEHDFHLNVNPFEHSDDEWDSTRDGFRVEFESSRVRVEFESSRVRVEHRTGLPCSKLEIIEFDRAEGAVRLELDMLEI